MRSAVSRNSSVRRGGSRRATRFHCGPPRVSSPRHRSSRLRGECFSRAAFFRSRTANSSVLTAPGRRRHPCQGAGEPERRGPICDHRPHSRNFGGAFRGRCEERGQKDVSLFAEAGSFHFRADYRPVTAQLSDYPHDRRFLTVQHPHHYIFRLKPEQSCNHANDAAQIGMDTKHHCSQRLSVPLERLHAIR